MIKPFKPELLAPAGDLERLEAAVYYGADAVYLGSTRFGMRAAPQNFTLEALRSAVDFAHANGVKVYLTCNIVARNNEIDDMPEFFREAAACGVDAFIITDLGVMEIAKKYAPDVDIHISTQAGVANYATANLLYSMGAKRVVTARELSLEEIRIIREKTPSDLEIECFVHGAMCVSFSGRCLLSNYLTNRDSNRGDCAQPCRWKFALTEERRPGEYYPIEQNDNGTFIFNSRDMSMIRHIAALVEAGVYSFKIEGRAKSAYYTAVATNSYRCAIDGYVSSGFASDYVPEQWIIEEEKKISNRDYCTGFYFGSPMDDANIYYGGGYIREWEVAAIADSFDGDRLTAYQRNRFFEGDELEIMEKGIAPRTVRVEDLRDENGEKIESAPHPTMKLSFKCPFPVQKGAYLRIRKK